MIRIPGNGVGSEMSAPEGARAFDLTGKTPREITEDIERKTLSSKAALAALSRGREAHLEPCSLRTGFQRDRDRIIHTKSFRRLKHKTQVFISPEGDHYRTRLTHTMEVSQISRTIARALRLNEDLAEAIALGHDLGHTPFGHIGETALTGFLPGDEEFRHNEQSLRVVEVLEYEGKGINLTWEVRDGILNHSGDRMPATLEGQVVRTADRIAYVNHDVDDAIRAGLISPDDLPRNAINHLGRHPGQRIDALVRDAIAASADLDLIRLSDRIARMLDDLREYLFEKVYLGTIAKVEEERAVFLLTSLGEHYSKRPWEMPQEYQLEKHGELPVRICDYIAGMTDRYAIAKFEELFLPNTWVD